MNIYFASALVLSPEDRAVNKTSVGSLERHVQQIMSRTVKDRQTEHLKAEFMKEGSAFQV